MKVLFLCPSLVGAGVERRVCTLLKELWRQDVDVRLGLLRGEGEFLSEVPSTRLIVEAPNPRFKSVMQRLFRSRDFINCVLAIFQIHAMIRKVQPDVLVSFTLETTIPSFFALGKAKKERVAWMISEDSNTAAATVVACDSALSTRIVQSLLGRIYRKAGHVNCVSTSVVTTVREVYRVDEARISSLSNPVDISRVEDALRNPSEALTNCDYILAVGRLVTIKQFDLLIRAFAEVRRTRELKLLILGEGPARENLSRVVAEHDLDNDVLLPGFIENPWYFMARAKLLVLSSKLEGFGNVIVEAMAAGCPVIATRCGGPEDVIRHGHNGLLVEQHAGKIADAIAKLLNDPELLRRLVENARNDVENYTPDKISARFGALLRQVAMKEGA